MKCTKRAVADIIKSRAANKFVCPSERRKESRRPEKSFFAAFRLTFLKFRLANLFALVLVSFSFTLILLALVQYLRTRSRAALIWIGAGVIFLFVFLLLASRFAVQIFGTLPLALELNQFAAEKILPLFAGIVGGAAAFGILVLARKHLEFALGAAGVGALILFVIVAYTSQPPPPLPEHPGIEQITLPEKFRVQAFASDVHDPSALAFDDAGNLYYSELVDGNIVRLRDADGDGVADEKKIFASGFNNPRGLAWHDGALYVSNRGPIDVPIDPNNVFIGQINTLRDTTGDGVADENKIILDNLFSLDIQHSNNGIAFGPDGKLYIAIGGPRVGQLELKDQTYWYEGQARDDWQFGGVLQANADGKNVKLFARGLRNPYAVTFDAKGNLFATDNGDETIPVPDGDELNLIEQGADYGYPYFFGIPPAWSNTRVPLFVFTPHTAPTDLISYDAKGFPPKFRGNLFVALYWHGLEGSQYRQVVRMSSDENGWTAHDFIQGLDRPVALALGPDGALYVADMRGGKADPEFPGAIYRVSYQGK